MRIMLVLDVIAPAETLAVSHNCAYDFCEAHNTYANRSII